MSQLPPRRHRTDEIYSGDLLCLELLKKGEAHFRERFPHPFLVVLSTPPEDEDWVGPITEVTDWNALKRAARATVSSFKVVRVAKSNRNVFGTKITVGRANNNDIILRGSKISKLHASFVPDPHGSFTLIDHGSTNGTAVNGILLQKNKPFGLNTGDKLSFWQYAFEYQDLDDFVEKLRTLSVEHGPL
jgi:hypothetical protein